MPDKAPSFCLIQDTYGFEVNSLGSTIPSELGQLSLTRHAYFDANEFTGTVPREVLNLPALGEESCYASTPRMSRAFVLIIKPFASVYLQRLFPFNLPA